MKIAGFGLYPVDKVRSFARLQINTLPEWKRQSGYNITNLPAEN